MGRTAGKRILLCLIATLIQVFGAIGPLWAFAARAGDPGADAQICAAHVPGDNAAWHDDAPAPRQTPASPCPHCQWCHAHPVAVTVPPLRVPLPRLAQRIVRDQPDTAAPRGPPLYAPSARAPPILT